MYNFQGFFDGNNAFLGSLVILTLKSIIFVVALLLETGKDKFCPF
jgi:hypothetical protein